VPRCTASTQEPNGNAGPVLGLLASRVPLHSRQGPAIYPAPFSRMTEKTRTEAKLTGIVRVDAHWHLAERRTMWRELASRRASMNCSRLPAFSFGPIKAVTLLSGVGLNRLEPEDLRGEPEAVLLSSVFPCPSHGLARACQCPRGRAPPCRASAARGPGSLK
jgi:hypothetical protein